jgi:hypothetical protein
MGKKKDLKKIFKSSTNQGMVVQAFNSSTWKAKAEGY